MKLKTIITALFFLGALFTGSAFAADAGDQPDTMREGPRGGMQGTPEQRPPIADQQREGRGVQDQQTGLFQEDRIPGMHRAENLVGETVVSQQGNDLGTIDDLVISQNGEVAYIILSRGGTMGVGGDMIPVPWEAANLQRGADDELMAQITEQQLEGAPTFNDYAQIGTQDYEQQVHSYFGTEPRTDREFQPGLQQDRPQMDQQQPN